MSACRVHHGDVRATLPQIASGTVQCCVTSPPYWGLRDYGAEGQIGLERTPEEYTAALVEVFREVRRVLRDDGVLWLNLGDSYAGSRAGEQGESGQMADRSVAKQRCRVRNGSNALGDLKNKDLVGIPWRVAFALQADGWYLRSDVIWSKPNPMPESVTDRPTKAHEYLFLLTKSERYFYDGEAIKERAVSDHSSGNGFKRDARLSYRDENGARGNDEQWTDVGGARNRRTVWTIPTQPYEGAHFATFPPALVEPCIKAGSKPGDLVLDPFHGAGTTGMVALGLGREYVGCELNADYIALSEPRLKWAAAHPESYSATPKPQERHAAQLALCK